MSMSNGRLNASQLRCALVEAETQLAAEQSRREKAERERDHNSDRDFQFRERCHLLKMIQRIKEKHDVEEFTENSPERLNYKPLQMEHRISELTAQLEELRESYRTLEPCGHARNFQIGDEHGNFTCTVCRITELTKEDSFALLESLRRNVANDWAMTFPKSRVMRKLLEWANLGYLVEDGVKVVIDPAQPSALANASRQWAERIAELTAQLEARTEQLSISEAARELQWSSAHERANAAELALARMREAISSAIEEYSCSDHCATLGCNTRYGCDCWKSDLKAVLASLPASGLADAVRAVVEAWERVKSPDPDALIPMEDLECNDALDALAAEWRKRKLVDDSKEKTKEVK